MTVSCGVASADVSSDVSSDVFHETDPVSGLSNLTTGWYCIKAGSSLTDVAGRYVTLSRPPLNYTSRSAYWYEFKADAGNDANSLFYITHTESNTTFIVKAFDGSYIKTTGERSDNSATCNVFVPDETTAPTQFKWGGTSATAGNLNNFRDANFPEGAYYLGLSSGTNTARYEFYKVDESKLSDIKQKAISLAVKKIGYPIATAYEAYVAAVNAAVDVTAISDAYATYCNAQIALPTEGKAYNIKPVFPSTDNSGTTSGVLYMDSEGLKYSGTETVENLGNKAIFVVGKDNDNNKMCLVSATTGKFMAYKGNNSYPYGNMGHNEAYEAANCGISCVAASDSYPFINGTFRIEMKNTAGTNRAVIVTPSGGFDGWNGGSNGYTNTYSNVFKFEEVDFANTVEFSSPESDDRDAESEKAYASLYLPFATIVPEGVTAYTASVATETVATEDNNTYKLSLTPVSGKLPAGTVVVLRSDAAGTYNFAPTIETVTAVEGNALTGYTEETAKPENSFMLQNGAAVTYDVDETTETGVGFYRYSGENVPAYKAVLVSSAVPSSVSFLALVFGNDDSVGITAVESDASAATTEAYDLQGRRVQKPVRGLYIIGGKKVFIK